MKRQKSDYVAQPRLGDFAAGRSYTAGFWAILAVTGLAVTLGAIGLERATRNYRSELAVPKHLEEIHHAPNDLIAGNAKGDVSIVAFFDYNCSECQADAPALRRLTASDGQVRLILKHLPVLGRDSEDAAKAVHAAANQGMALKLHKALESANGRMTKLRALYIAEQVGLDRTRLEQDMNSPDVVAMLEANRKLADALGVRGVPFYLVGDRVFSTKSEHFYSALADRVVEVRGDG